MVDYDRRAGSPLVLQLREALRSALLRHQADHAAGRTAEDARAVGERLAALLIEKHCAGPGAVADMALRAAMAAALSIELDALVPGETGRAHPESDS